MMSVLFIAHGKRTQPQGLVDLAAFLRQRGHAVALEHVYDDLRYIGRIKYEPDIVGLSAHTENAGRLRKVVGTIRERWPAARVVIGGPHVNSDVLEKEPDFAGLADWLVMGEGEYAMEEIIGGREPGIIQGTPLSQDDFAALPMPDAEQITRIFKWRPSSVLINRGCPYSCSFCHANRKRLVYRSPGRVVAYLANLDRALPGQQWFVLDDVFAVNKRWLAEFADEVQRQKFKAPLRCFINGNVYDEERHDLLRRAGVVRASIGAESGNDDVLRLANKGTTMADYERIDAIYRKSKTIRLHGLWILGLPGETPESIKQTLDAAKRIGQMGPSFGYATPYPGTQFYKTASEHGEIVEPDWHKWTPNRISFVPHGVTQTLLRDAMRRGKAMGHR